ncbi:Reverse transcriptase domain-containing protein, partial [Aphis craccivora]
MSDEWKPYKVLQNKGYNHFTVNYSEHFVDSLTGTNTQTIECIWSHRNMKILRKFENCMALQYYIRTTVDAAYKTRGYKVQSLIRLKIVWN